MSIFKMYLIFQINLHTRKCSNCYNSSLLFFCGAKIYWVSLLAPKDLVSFPVLWLWAYLTTVIPEMCFSYFMARTNYYPWDDNDVRFVLNQHAKSDFYSASSVKSLWVDMLGHLNTWFWANQSLLLLLNAACLAEKQQIPIS